MAGERTGARNQAVTYSLFDLAELLKLLAEGRIVGVPRKASVQGQQSRV